MSYIYERGHYISDSPEVEAIALVVLLSSTSPYSV